MQHIQGSRGGPVSVRTHGSCAPGLCHRLRPLLGKSVTLRVETWPEASRNPLWGILWVFIIGDFYVVLGKNWCEKVLCVCAQSCPPLCNSVDCARQAPLCMGSPRPECWSGLPFPPPGDLPDPGSEPTSPASQADSLPLSHLRSPVCFALKSWCKRGDYN